MARALKIAAIVVGVAAMAIPVFGQIAGPAAFASLATSLGVSAATLTAIGTALAVASSILGLAAGMMAKKPKLRSSGQQLDFVADPSAGQPYVVGDAMVGESIVHQATWGAKNKFLGMVGVISCAGPIMAYDGLYADMTLVPFASGNASGYYHDFMYLQTQIGAVPEASALSMVAPGGTTMPDWGAAYKTSGLATTGLVLVADIDKGKIYSGGLPKLTNRVRGVKAYDARADSTQPGGSGTQRALDETTYVYSANPWVHTSTFAIGRWANGVRVIGPGLAPAQIDWPAFIEASNVADANGWKVSGQAFSTDRKWDVLKAMAQAGGGYPMPTTGLLSCLVNAPKVSIETITEKDVKGAISAPQMFTRRERLNGAIPRFRSADHGWEVTPGNTVRNAGYLAADGGREATREIEFPFLADTGDGAGKTQAAQLTAYEVANSRERAPISVELGYLWAQLKLGDCVTLDLPSANLNSQKAVVISRDINVSRNTITLGFRTEDDAKHTWALSQTGSTVAPPTVAQPPGTGDGVETALQATQLIKSSQIVGLTFTVGVPSGGTSAVTVSNHSRVYDDKTVAVTGDSALSVACASGDLVFCYYDDDDRSGGAQSYQFLVLPAAVGDTSPAFASVDHPYRHTVFSKIVPASGGSTGGGSGAGSGGGGGGGGGGYVYPPGPAQP